MQLLLQVLNTEPKTDGKASEIAIDVATQTGEEIPFADILAAAHTAAKGATADIVLPEPGRKVPETRHALLGDTLVSQGEGDLPGDPLVATPAPLLKGPLPDAKPDIPTGEGPLKATVPPVQEVGTPPLPAANTPADITQAPPKTAISPGLDRPVEGAAPALPRQNVRPAVPLASAETAPAADLPQTQIKQGGQAQGIEKQPQSPIIPQGNAPAATQAPVERRPDPRSLPAQAPVAPETARSKPDEPVRQTPQAPQVRKAASLPPVASPDAAPTPIDPAKPAHGRANVSPLSPLAPPQGQAPAATTGLPAIASVPEPPRSPAPRAARAARSDLVAEVRVTLPQRPADGPTVLPTPPAKPPETGLIDAGIGDFRQLAVNATARDEGLPPLAPAESGEARRQGDLPLPKVDPAPRPVLAQLVQAAKSAIDGMIEVKLSPEELGRVRLAMTTVESGMTVLVTAERAETLDLIRRNIDLFAADLAKQGFTDLSFSFGGDTGGEHGGAEGEGHSLGAFTPVDGPAEAKTGIASHRIGPDGRVDLRV